MAFAWPRVTTSCSDVIKCNCAYNQLIIKKLVYSSEEEGFMSHRDYIITDESSASNTCDSLSSVWHILQHYCNFGSVELVCLRLQ